MNMESPGDDGGFAAVGEEVVPGARIAGYRVTGRIGRGGMAVVFQALDERLGRLVALKVLAPVLAGDEAFRQRFIRESRAAAAVDDPHIIPVFEAGEAGGVLFIAMRYVAGGDIRSLIRRAGPLEVRRAALIVSSVAAALDAAHAAGLVHRDVKPANMLIDSRPGRPDHVYLSDFGLSKGALASVGLTGSGLLLGTPDYVSPEQIAGNEVDGRVDQYALACAAFEILSGLPPFARDHGMAVIYAHASQPPPALTARRPGLPAAVDEVIARAMAKDPADRYESCQAFAGSLREALGIEPYDMTAGADGAERPGTVVVPQPAVSDMASPGTGSPGAGPAAGPPSARDSEPLAAAGPVDDETITRLPLEVGRSGAGALASKRPVGPGQGTASSGPVPGKRSSRRLLVLGAAGVVAAAAVIGSAAALNSPDSPSASGAHARQSPVITSSPARLPVKSGALVTMKPVPGGQFDAVFAGSGHSIWAVGNVWAGNKSTGLLAERWNGVDWSRVAVPGIRGAEIASAAAGPDGTAWAVGSVCPGTCPSYPSGHQTLVLHWDGASWSRIPSPNPPGGGVLAGVAAERDGTAWAVGFYLSGGSGTSFALHWNGTAWSRSAIPYDAGFALAAEPDGTVWAVGPPVLRFNGTSWTQVPSPNVYWVLDGASAGPGETAWAVGDDCTACVTHQERDQTVVLHWDGAKWSRVPSPNPDGNAILNGVAAGPGNTAWAVGNYCAPGCAYGDGEGANMGHTLILRWDGSTWALVPSPSPGGADALNAVTAGDDGTAWAAGTACTSGCKTSSAVYQTLILRWNGTAWTPG